MIIIKNMIHVLVIGIGSNGWGPPAVKDLGGLWGTRLKEMQSFSANDWEKSVHPSTDLLLWPDQELTDLIFLYEYTTTLLFELLRIMPIFLQHYSVTVDHDFWKKDVDVLFTGYFQIFIPALPPSKINLTSSLCGESEFSSQPEPPSLQKFLSSPSASVVLRVFVVLSPSYTLRSFYARNWIYFFCCFSLLPFSQPPKLET